MQRLNLLSDLAEAQRGSLLLWMPIGLALGNGAYFAFRFEPTTNLYLGLTVVVCIFLLLRRFMGYPGAILLGAAILAMIGFLNAGISAHRKAAPVLSYHYYGPVEGRIVAVDRSASNKPRITLDRVRLRRVSAAKTPHKIRISLHYPRQFISLMPGRNVMLTASLSPPSGPVEPGGFDFQRFAWFRSLGAIGYSRTPVLEFAPPAEAGWAMALMRLRMRLAVAIRGRIGGQTGAFAAAILVGDRSAIAPEMLDRLRASNLAHLLAISGLHMGLLTGFVFTIIRYGLALLPFLALRLPVKKIAAIGAFCVAVSYLFLSGANVATQRAFIMVAVMLLAILLDRRALTLRAVALAAVIVLVVRPESLIEAGFQMSFAATTALVAVFATLRDHGVFVSGGGPFWGVVRWAFALVLSSAIAGAATAPISAFHFNQIAQYGLVANLASVPAMGLLVMPSAVLAILLSPLGLDGLAWAGMGAGIDWILFIAGKVAGLDGAVVQIVKPSTFVLIFIGMGALWLILVRGRLRFIGLILILVAGMMWSLTERPAILLSANGRLLGVMGANGRALNREKGTGFVARNWLENDGDAASQQTAWQRFSTADDGIADSLEINGFLIGYSWQKDIDPATMADLCQQFTLVILPQISASQNDCAMIDKKGLKRLGSVAISGGETTLTIKGARQVTGRRLWSK